jgi:hypothetical protein
MNNEWFGKDMERSDPCLIQVPPRIFVGTEETHEKY